MLPSPLQSTPPPIRGRVVSNTAIVQRRSPCVPSMPPPTLAVLPVTMLSLTVSAERQRMPPPLAAAALPPVIVRPLMLAVTPESTWNTREALLPLMVS